MQAARDVRTLLDDDTTFYVASLASVAAADAPIAQIGAEYFAPCFTPAWDGWEEAGSEGDLLFLALPVSPNWRTALAPNATATVLVHANPDPRVVDMRHSTTSSAGRVHWESGRPLWRKGMPSKGRTSMTGQMHVIEAPAASTAALAKCFTHYHPDAAAWMPGSRASPHVARWARFTPEHIYYVGGFGDEHYIGTVPLGIYRKPRQALVMQSARRD